MRSTVIDERQKHQLQHQTNNYNSSSNGSVERSSSIGPGRSSSRPPAAPQVNPNVSKSPANFSKPVSTSPESRRRPSASHRRSSSIGGLKDGVGNLNRWSQSTTSSKGSVAHNRSNSLSRRMSFGNPGSFSFGISTTEAAVGDSPSKLKKSRTNGDSISSQHTSNPIGSLPPLITLPTHRTQTGENPSPLTSVTPSTAGLLSAAVRTAVPDYFSRSWDGQPSHNPPRSSSKARSPINPSPLSAGPPTNIATGESSGRRERQGSESGPSQGHSRHRSSATKSSGGTVSSDKSKDRSSKPPSQKAMLSKALQKANTAVVLDNAQNFEGAMEAYSEACDLLQQVMLRSSGEEDRRKLEAIRNTYSSRILELEKIAPHLQEDDKALPARPESSDYRDGFSPAIEDDDGAVIGMAVMTRIVNHDSYESNPRSGHIAPSQVPRRRDSLLPSPFDTGSHKPSAHLSEQYVQNRNASRSPGPQRAFEKNTNLSPPMDRQYMPPPLSPRRMPSSAGKDPRAANEGQRIESYYTKEQPNRSSANGHRREPSSESMSWLDTIDESGGSTASSVHSRTSSLGIRRKHIRAASGATEAEFDAALDAAVEAAYDEGFEPADVLEDGNKSDDYEDELASMRQKVEMARERVRQTERETAIHLARDRERTRLLNEQSQVAEDDYDDNESEEEERMLEEMTRGYIMDDFEFGLQSKSALPRESDSSGFSGRTWHSSIGSNPTTAGTSLSTVAEALPRMPPLQSKTPPPLYPPPGQALPTLPKATNASQSLKSMQMPLIDSSISTHTVRSRRLSGQNPKQLKIETAPASSSRVGAKPSQPPPVVRPAIPAEWDLTIPPAELSTSQSQQASGLQASSTNLKSSRRAPSPLPPSNATDVMPPPPTPTLTQNFNQDADNLPRSGSPARALSRSGIRKNFSSSSLKNLKNRNLSITNIDDGSDASPNTPMNSQFAPGTGMRDATGKVPAIPTLPTPIATAFREKMNGLASGGLYLFDSGIHSPESPGMSGPLSPGAPIPLEPCPTEYLLRPFWLMRAIYQTLAHSRGGYISTKLFVPRDVWRVKGVKIKGLEEKIACCDFLTAALQKLGQVDTFDADAVLDEMQSLEGVLEQVQVTLTRKLGNEVGLQGSGMLFKDAPPAGDAENIASGPKTPGLQSKSSSFSWRRLRSKSSGVGLSNNYTSKNSGDGPKEALTMSTLPMTSLSTIRFAKRDVSQVQFSGPNANYMGALARLFDAAQVIDQIARQVVDPGLRHADKTQVGLELSTRHAAEFFGFYVCRFVLTDIGLMLDKFIKRGSEWVLV